MPFGCLSVRRGTFCFSGIHTISSPIAQAWPWPYGQLIGDTFLFYEAQRGGNIEQPDYRIPWRKNHLLDDGQDIKRNLTGGHYEAGSTLLLCNFCLPSCATCSVSRATLLALQCALQRPPCWQLCSMLLYVCHCMSPMMLHPPHEASSNHAAQGTRHSVQTG